jgi:hypothetical protein
MRYANIAKRIGDKMDTSKPEVTEVAKAAARAQGEANKQRDVTGSRNRKANDAAISALFVQMQKARGLF